MFSQYIVTCQSKQGLFFIYQLVIGIYREGMSWEELGQWCELSWVPLSYGGKFATSTATPVLYSGAPTLKQSPAAPVNEPIIPWSIKGKRVWCQMKQEIIDEHGGHRTALIFCKARSSAQTSNKNELFLHANERSFQMKGCAPCPPCLAEGEGKFANGSFSWTVQVLWSSCSRTSLCVPQRQL